MPNKTHQNKARKKQFQSQDKTPFYNNESHTLNQNFRYDSEFDNSSQGINGVYKAITTINNRLDKLEEENKELHKELNDTRTRENKLLNRFSWLILILDIGSAILIIMSIILFFDSIYPFIKKLMDTSIGATFVFGAIGTAISGGIIALWCTFNKYVKEVIEREKKQ